MVMWRLTFCPQPPEWGWMRPRAPRPRPPRRPWAWVLLGALTAELLVLARDTERQREPESPDAQVEEGAVLITTEGEWQMGEKPIRRVIPPAPQSDWARPPCADWQEEISGACWAEMARARPPCPGGLYEHKGRCYSPVVKGKRPPTSFQRTP